MATFTTRVKYLGKIVDEDVDGKPVYGYACGRIEDIQVLQGRHIDELIILGSPIPVYGVARECCLGPEEELVYGCLETDPPEDLTQLFYDSFTDTNGTSLASHTPDVDLSSAGWTIDSGAWDIQSNQLRASSAAPAICQAMIDPGASNVYIAVVHAADSADYAAVVVRGSYRVLYKSDGTDNFVYLQQALSGTVVASAAHTWAPGDFIEVVAYGTIIEVYINTALKISYLTAHLGLANTVHGVYVARLAETATHRFDDFELWNFVDPIPIGIPRTMEVWAAIDTVTNKDLCGEPACFPFTITYDDTQMAWLGGSIQFRNGSLSVRLECNGDGTFNVYLTGCDTITYLNEVPFTDNCGSIVLARSGLVALDATDCCECPQMSPTFSWRIEGRTPSWVRLARHIDEGVVHGGTPKPVYGFVECCDDRVSFAPRCCARLPCTLQAEITSDCECINGLIVPIHFNANPFPRPYLWSGSIELECGIVGVSLACNTIGALDEPHVPNEEDTCQEETICEPQGYESCTTPHYLAGNLIVSVGCNDVGGGTTSSVWTNVETCGVCDCDELDMVFGLIGDNLFPACGCAIEDGTSVRISI